MHTHEPPAGHPRIPSSSPAVDAAEPCAVCQKPPPLCLCDEITPIKNKVALLVLQHPQEQDRLLGTARLATQHLTNAAFRIGLSWPSLAKALERPADPADWAILHLGSTRPDALPTDREVVILDKKGVVMVDQDKALAELKGIVLFDGTWSQAKTLWWRNAWVLKAKRIVLNPREPSLYGKLRREPRREGLSTIEAAGLALSKIERRPEIKTLLNATFAEMLKRFRANAADSALAGGLKKANTKPKRQDFRRKRPAGKTPK